MDFDAKPVLEGYAGPDAVDAMTRWANLTRGDAEKAVLAAGGSPEYGAPPEPARPMTGRELSEAMDAALAGRAPADEKADASARARAAARDQKERQGRLREVLADMHRRIRDLERRHGMEPRLSGALAGADTGQSELEGAWDEACREPDFREIDGELRRFSERATAKNLRDYLDAPVFCCCAAAADLPDIVEKNRVPKSANYHFASLTSDFGVAARFAGALGGAVLEYDGDSIRGAGKSAPVKYSHRCSARGKSVGRGMPLAFCLEAEARMLL